MVRSGGLGLAVFHSLKGLGLLGFLEGLGFLELLEFLDFLEVLGLEVEAGYFITIRLQSYKKISLLQKKREKSVPEGAHARQGRQVLLLLLAARGAAQRTAPAPHPPGWLYSEKGDAEVNPGRRVSEA